MAAQLFPSSTLLEEKAQRMRVSGLGKKPSNKLHLILLLLSGFRCPTACRDCYFFCVKVFYHVVLLRNRAVVSDPNKRTNPY